MCDVFRPEYQSADAAVQQRLDIPNRPDIKSDGIRNLADYFLTISHFARERQWWFRGEAMQYEYANLPKFARNYYSNNGQLPKFKTDKLEYLIAPQKSLNGHKVFVSCITKQEIEIIEEFRKHPPSDEFFTKLVGLDNEGVGWLSYAQHYGFSTRLLDVSSDPLVALYFACCGHPFENGYVWLFPMPSDMHKGKLPNDYRKTFDVGISDTQALDFYREGRLDEYLPHSDILPLESSFLLRIEKPNRRVVAQRGQFLWSPHPLRDHSKNALVIMVNKDAKTDILAVLSSFGIHFQGLCL